MGLIKKQPEVSYDLSEIKPGDLFYGRHRTWDEGKAGIVTSATEKMLVVQYYPGIMNVTNHFLIPAAELAGGEWEARWSTDLGGVYEYTPEPGQEETEGKEELDGT